MSHVAGGLSQPGFRMAVLENEGPVSERGGVDLQSYLANKKQPPRRTLQ